MQYEGRQRPLYQLSAMEHSAEIACLHHHGLLGCELMQQFLTA